MYVCIHTKKRFIEGERSNMVLIILFQHDMHEFLLEIRFHYPLPTACSLSNIFQNEQRKIIPKFSSLSVFQLQHMKRLYQILTSTQNVSFNLSKSTNDTVASLYHQTKRTDACYAALCDESSPNIFYQTKLCSYGIDALSFGWSVSSAHSCGSGTCACASIWYLAA